MKANVTRFRTLALGLVQMKQFVTAPKLLWTGAPIERFGGLRPREIWGNWLIAAVCSVGREQELSLVTDPDGPNGSDGIIWDPATEVGWHMEHIMLPVSREGDTRSNDERIIDAVNKKQGKGQAAYAKGKILVILNESATNERWHPTAVARNIPKNDFDDIWVVGLHSYVDGAWTFGVTQLSLNAETGQAPIFHVRINSEFTAWAVTQVQ